MLRTSRPRGDRVVGRPNRFPIARPSAVPAALALVAGALAVGLTACGSREDDALGLGILGSYDSLKAVRTLDVPPPDATSDFQLTGPAPDAATASTLTFGGRAGYRVRTLIRPETSLLPPVGTTVFDPRIHVAIQDMTTDTGELTLVTRRVLSFWDEVDFDTDGFPAVATEAVDTVTVTLDPEAETIDIPVDGFLDFWASNPDSAFGIVLDPIDGETSILETFSRNSGGPPVIWARWNTGTTDTSVTIATLDDAHVIESPAFTPLTGQTNRITVARGWPARGLLRFAIPDRDSIPALWDQSTINAATLTLHVDSTNSAFHELSLAMRRVTAEPWDGENTAVDSLLYAVGTLDEGATEVTLDVRNVVVALFNSGEDNHGFLLRMLDERTDVDYVRFFDDPADPARRPELKIWYTPVGPGGGS